MTPESLLELWRVALACARHAAIMIVQAANTGLTGGSAPFGDYDRPVVIISTTRLVGVLPLKGGEESLCLAGSTLTELEDTIRPMGRLPHSVIGSSCIGASVVGGVCNNSGGALVRRGSAYTENSLYARVNEAGELELINHLGRDLGSEPEEILRRLDAGDIGVEISEALEPVRDVPDHVDTLRALGDEPTRFNADTRKLFEAAGCAGKLIVFAVRVPTFEAPRRERSFIVGTNSAEDLTRLRREMLSSLVILPSVCEYVSKGASDLAAQYGRDVCQLLRMFGARIMPRVLETQKRVDVTLRRIGLSRLSSAKISQLIFKASPHPLPKNMRALFDTHDHLLLITTDDDGIEPLKSILEELSSEGRLDYLEPSEADADAAFRVRFASAGATVRIRDISKNAGELAALDVALPGGTRDWGLLLPEHLNNQIMAKAIYGHFLCHVFHLDYVLKPGVDREEFELEIKALIEAQGGQMPAEHNFGHLYEAPPPVVEFYKKLDPTNSLNPGIGKTSRERDWA